MRMGEPLNALTKNYAPNQHDLQVGGVFMGIKVFDIPLMDTNREGKIIFRCNPRGGALPGPGKPKKTGRIY